MPNKGALAYPAGAPELDQTLLQVAEGALHQAARLLEVRQQRRPQRLLGQQSRVAQHHNTALCARQRTFSRRGSLGNPLPYSKPEYRWLVMSAALSSHIPCTTSTAKTFL